MHYYQFNIGDYTLSTVHLTAMEDIAYRRLLDLYYQTESPIPQETDWVARKIRIDEEFIILILNEFFTKESDGWHHARCDQEIAIYQSRAARNRDNGKRGGRPKSIDSIVDKPTGLPNGINKKPSGNLNQEPITNNHKPKDKDIDIPADLNQSAWNTWVEYRKSIKKPIKDASKETAMKAMVKYGEDQMAVVEQSIANGWQGLFDLKADKKKTAQPQETQYQTPPLRAFPK